MFKKLKNKIQVELDKEQTSANVSMCSSMSSSRADLTQEEQNLQKQQAFDSLAALVVNDIEEEDDSEEIVQKFTKPVNSGNNLASLNDENGKMKEHEQVLDDLLNKVEHSLNNSNKVHEQIQVNKQSIKASIDNGSIESDDQVNKLLNDLKSKNIVLDDLQEKFQKLEQKLKEQINQNKKLENLNMNLQNTKHEVNLRNNKLFNKLDEMKKQLKQTQDKMNQLKDENRNLVAKNDEMHQRLKSMKEDLDFEREEKNELKNEFNRFKLSVQTKNESKMDKKLIDDLKEKIIALEDQVAEKNKTIKLQNQRIHDIKKSVQKGDLFLRDDSKSNDRAQSNGNLENGYSSRNDSSTKLDEQVVNGKSQSNEIGKLNNSKDYATHVSDINFKYLQNVVLKFITSNDHESQKHLVKAISTVLKFSNEEEQIIKQSLETRTSWFKI